MKCGYLTNHACIRSNGQYRLCCISTEKDNRENIKTHTPQEWLDSSTVKEAKKNLEQNKWPDACLKCEKLESKGITSKRQSANFSSPGITHLDIRFGNSCNLKCLFCWHMSSSSIAQEAIDMQNAGIQPIHEVMKNPVINWADEDSIKKIISYPLEEVYLTGGEPMMVKHLPLLLEKLDPEITLRFNTNCTIWNNKLEKLLRRFKKVKMDVSIDAIGEKNDYIRFGSKWNIVTDNFLKYKEFCEVNITPTISILNAAYTHEIEEWADSVDTKIVWNMLDNPKWLHVKNAPTQLKSLFNNTSGWHNDKIDDTEIVNFKKYIKKLDKFRGVNIKDYLPEVASAYDIN